MAETAKKSTTAKTKVDASTTTKTKANAKSNKSNASKFAIFGISIAAVIAIIIGIVVAIKANPTINDDYFVSDGSKYVINMSMDDESSDEGIVGMHIVYYYSGDTVTGAKSFYEFKDEATAKAAYDELKNASDEDTGSYSLNGKYVVLAADDDTIKNLTVDEVKSQVEFYENLKNYTTEE